MSDELEQHYNGAVLNDRSAIGKTFANHSYLDHKSFANISLLKTSLEGRTPNFNPDKDISDALDRVYMEKANDSLLRTSSFGGGRKLSQVGAMARQKLSNNERFNALRESIRNTKIL